MIEFLVTRHRRRLADMNTIGHIVLDLALRHIDGDDQHGDATFGNRSLAGDHRLSPRLFRRVDHVAVDAATAVDVLEIDFLYVIKSKFAARHLARDQDNRRTITMAFEETVDKVEAARSAASCDR